MNKIIGSLVLLGCLSLTSLPAAEAHRVRTKIKGPLGSWTWGPDTPHVHQAPAKPTPKPKKHSGSFKIRNLCNKPITYWVSYKTLTGKMNTKSQTLRPREFSYLHYTSSYKPYMNAETTTKSDFWSEPLYVKSGDNIIHNVGKNCR